ncbi:MAG TPA: hypothetical protein VIM61_09585, partial [Chthoniobacterales bacterium]
MATQTPPPEIIEDEEPGFFQRFRVPIIIGGLVLIGGIAFAVTGKHDAPKRKTPQVVSISLPP